MRDEPNPNNSDEQGCADGLIDGFAAFLLIEQGLSSETVETYTAEVTRFLGFIKERGWIVSAVRSEDVLAYLVARREDPHHTRHARTIAKALSILRKFLDWLLVTGVMTDNPAALIAAPKGEKNPPRVLSVGEIEKLLCVIDHSTTLGLRDRALFELIYSSGLRISEASTLPIDALSLSEGLVRVTGKGNKERIVPMAQETVYWIERYIRDSRPRLQRSSTHLLFLGARGGSISRREYGKDFIIGLTLRVLTHTCTHFVTPSLPIYWKEALIFARYKRCWDTPI